MANSRGAPTWFWLVILGAGGYAVYKIVSALGKTGEKAKDVLVDVGTQIWLTLDPLPPAVQLLGNVALPDGSLVSLNQVQLKTNKAGDVFTKIGPTLYQLGPHDADGNYPATPVGG